MEWTDHALVLHVGCFREADMWVRLLTRRQGVLTVFAFGGSRSRRRFCGCLDICNSIVCRVKSGKNSSYFALQEASLLRGLRRLRGDGRSLGVIMNCLRFLEVFGVHGEGAAKAFALAEETVRLLEEAPPVSSLFALLFRLRLVSDQGFAPALRVCAGCGREAREEESRGEERADGHWRFIMEQGAVFCPSCRGVGRHALDMSLPGIEFLRDVQHSAPEMWSSAGLSPAERRQCGRAVDAFVQYHLGIAWEDGRFRRV
jgi:DNA repair protein RecO (recombination protein O)